MVREATAESGERFGVVTRVARQLGVGAETLRLWVNQAEVDAGQRPGLSTEEGQRIAALEREIRELRRANEILKAASAFFAREARPATSEVVKFINAERNRFGVEPICLTLKIAPSTYYSAISRPCAERGVGTPSSRPISCGYTRTISGSTAPRSCGAS